MKYTFRILAILLASMMVIGLSAFSAGADDQIFISAAAALAETPFTVTADVTYSQDGTSDSYTASYIRNANGDVKVLGESELYDQYFTIDDNGYAVVINYYEDVLGFENGWFSEDENSMSYWWAYSYEYNFEFLYGLSDVMFDISVNGNITTLTAKAEYANTVGYAFIGDYSDEEYGVTDEYTSVVITITDGVISGFKAENVYTQVEEGVTYTANYTYDYTYTPCDAFTIPEYTPYISLEELDFTLAGEWQLNTEVEITGDTYYSFTPDEDCLVKFTSSSDNENLDNAMICYLNYADNLYSMVDYLDDTDESYIFDGYMYFDGGVTYILNFFNYEGSEGIPYTVTSCIAASFYGEDVNGDGYIDSADAAAVLQYDLGLVDFTEDQVYAADANLDGVVDSADASMYLQYDLGLIE